MTRRGFWAVGIFVFVLGESVLMQMRGPLLVSFQSSFRVDESMLGLVAPAGTVGFIISLTAVGFKTGLLNERQFLVAASVGTGLTSLSLGFTSSFSVLLLFLFFQGIASGVFRAIDRPVLSHLFPENRGSIFSLYTLVWAVGATLAPLYVNYTKAVEGWRTAYLALAVIFVLPAVVLWVFDTPGVVGNEELFSTEDLFPLLRRRPVHSMGIAVVFSGGIEGSLFTWLPYYATQYVSSSRANLLLSLYFVSYIPGRLAYSYLIDRYQKSSLLLVLAGVALPTYAIFVTTTGLYMVGSIVLLGLLISGFFPILLAIGIDAAPQYSGPINAIATIGNFAGITTFPFVIGVSLGFTSITTAMVLPFFLIASLLATSLGFRYLT